MNNQVRTSIQASPNFLDGSTGIPSWEDDVTTSAYSQSGSKAPVSYRTASGFGIVEDQYDNQVDYSAPRGAGEGREINFNGNRQVSKLYAGLSISRAGSEQAGRLKSVFC